MSDQPYADDKYWPDPLPVAVLVGREREGNTLCVLTRDIWFHSRQYGLRWRVPAGYLTDWASIPAFAQAGFQPFGRHAWAAFAHDWLYSVGEPGMRGRSDDIFLEKLEDARVHPLRRTLMFRAVRTFGGGYAKAAARWPVQSFADPDSGAYRDPPFARESAFWGGPNGPEAWTPEHMR